MTEEQINAAIAEACGWRKEDGVYMWEANGIDCTYPELWDWCNDLNAMHVAEKMLGDPAIRREYVYLLGRIVNACSRFDAIHATARQRAEAFLRTLGKWE